VGEYPLRGGSVNTVVRAGDTVRRRPGGRFVHELLGFFERSGWGGAPRFLGLDEQGREILSFVEGYVPWQEPGMPGVTAEASLVQVAELVREFHDLTPGTPLAGDAQVVCHNDLAPNNTVYSPGGSGALCWFHHQIAIHRWGWTLVLNPDGTTTAWNKDKTKVLHSHGPPVRPG